MILAVQQILLSCRGPGPPEREVIVSDRPTPVGALLRAAPPDRLPEVVAEHLRRHFAAGRGEILPGDLALTGLWRGAGAGRVRSRSAGAALLRQPAPGPRCPPRWRAAGAPAVAPLGRAA